MERIPRVLAAGQVVLLILAAGCNEPLPEAPATPARQTERTVSHFDPQTAGEIHGQVTWQGPIPTAAPFVTQPVPLAGEILGRKQVRPNPNLPVVDSRTRGVGNAVVYLRHVSPDNSKPWDHPPVHVEMRGCQLHVVQGGSDSSVGFVRSGDAVQMVSADKFFHLLHADGAAFWNFAFPDPGSPLSRELDKKGIVELSSGAGYFWMRAYLFVDDHPYYARTNREGQFVLAHVPPGRYEIVCWLPNWHKARHERDPETGMISRLYFEEPITAIQTVVIGNHEHVPSDFALSAPSAAVRR